MSILDKLRPPSIFAKSTPDSGDASALEAPLAADERRGAMGNARPGTRALIADDSPTIVAALKKILQPAGFVTMEAANSSMALSLARGGIPDIIFLDIVLPGDSGFSVLRSLRKDASTAHIPVIMMSGNERATELFFGRRTGADDFMKKPFLRREVFARIARLLDEDGVPRRASPPAPLAEADPER